MIESRIAFTRRERCSGLIRFGVFTLLMGTLALYAILKAYAASLGERWFLPVMFAVMWLPCAFYVVNRMFGVTGLSQEGMRLRTLVSRRRIPWREVTAVEVRRRSGRGGSWQVVRVQLVHGRPVVLPGAMQSQMAQNAAGFAASVATICSYWQEATGCTDQPVYVG